MSIMRKKKSIRFFIVYENTGYLALFLITKEHGVQSLVQLKYIYFYFAITISLDLMYGPETSLHI